jgi:peptidoglycan/LPS O-acetylase OafA/YrhL
LAWQGIGAGVSRAAHLCDAEAGPPLLSRDSHTIRWVSDSSYWLYLTHLLLVHLAQGLSMHWHVPALVTFPVIDVGCPACCWS